ncbi:MAG: hypothetical protein EYC62_02865 [Alphaproteobacteria bacterium]|nr:MAG: hypothetical protein EYC62_02865 [Alphaproteobacteria bacterium]
MMPQLDLATYPSQLFWLAVNFALLYWLMAKLALPRIGQILDARAAAIKADLDNAAKLKAEAENIILNHDKNIADAKNRARYLVKQAHDEIAFERDKQLNALDKKLEARVADAEARMNTAKGKMLQQVNPLSEELANLMVQKLLGKTQTNGDYNAPVKKEARG